MALKSPAKLHVLHYYPQKSCQLSKNLTHEVPFCYDDSSVLQKIWPAVQIGRSGRLVPIPKVTRSAQSPQLQYWSRSRLQEDPRMEALHILLALDICCLSAITRRVAERRETGSKKKISCLHFSLLPISRPVLSPLDSTLETAIRLILAVHPTRLWLANFTRTYEQITQYVLRIARWTSKGGVSGHQL